MTNDLHRQGLILPDQAISEPAIRSLGHPDRRRIIGTGRASRPVLGRLRRMRLGVAASDAVAFGGVLSAMVFASGWDRGTSAPAISVVVGSAVWVATFRAFGLYRLSLSSWDEFRRLLGATAVGVSVVVLLPWWVDEFPGRSSVLLAWALSFLLVLLGRGLFRWETNNHRRAGRLSMTTVIVGTPSEARRIAQALSSAVGSFRVAGYVTTTKEPTSPAGLQALGSLAELDEVIHREQIECVILPSTAMPKDVLRTSRACRQGDAEMRLWANVPEILTPRLSFHNIAGSALIALTPLRLSRLHAAMKRSFDVVVASLGLVLALPLLATIALSIILTSRGPVLFRQTRATKNGRLFTMYKFRTMVADPEKALAGGVIDLTEPFFKLRDDPRLTGIGRLLRRWSLDELPQLVNVLRGDMSIVGPRPLPIEQVKANPDLLGPRHEMRSGITGWWQVSGRSEVDSEEAIRLDLYYIENWSIGLDLYILLRTLGAVVVRRGAW